MKPVRSNGQTTKGKHARKGDITQKGRPRKRTTNESNLPTTELVNELSLLDLCTPSVSNDFVRYYISGVRSSALDVDPGHYDCSEHFACDYLVSELLSKCKTLSGSDDELRRMNALARWSRAEASCFATNCSFRAGGHLGHIYELNSVKFSSGDILNRMRSLVRAVLGEVTPDVLERIYALAGHGAGGTTRLKRREAGLCTKFSGIPEASPNVISRGFASMLATLYPEWLQAGVKPQRYGKMATVPKNSQTDRVICSEPDLNIFLQKGVGSYLKQRMLSRAFTSASRTPVEGFPMTIDLSSQEHNQRAAKYGSETGLYGTVDLSMASDTVSFELVRAVFPEDWFDLLSDLRTGSVAHCDGSHRHQEKFSAMGNGFTFEVETLIFWALLRSLTSLSGIGDSPVLVYGDDLVVPVELCANGVLEHILAVLGFTFNSKKTWISGPFRESCGKHYFKGKDVTPFYVRKDVMSISDKILTLNNLRRWLSHRSSDIKSAGLSAWDRLRYAWLPKQLRQPSIPDGYGDGALIGNLQELQALDKAPLCASLNPRSRRYKKFNGWEGRVCRTYVPTLGFEVSQEWGTLVASLFRLSRRVRRTNDRWFLVSSILETHENEFLSWVRGERQHPPCQIEQFGMPEVLGYRPIDMVCVLFPEL